VWGWAGFPAAGNKTCGNMILTNYGITGISYSEYQKGNDGDCK
jgi:hypothetical protein